MLFYYFQEDLNISPNAFSNDPPSSYPFRVTNLECKNNIFYVSVVILRINVLNNGKCGLLFLIIC